MNLQTTPLNETKCPNCGNLDSGAFCSICGNSLTVKRISIALLLSSIVDFFYNIEGKYTRTCKLLFTQPTTFIKDYIGGNRDDYYIPFKYFFLNLSINFFVYTYFKIGTLSVDNADDEFDAIVQLKSEIMFDHIMDNYGNFISLLVIPVYVFMATKLFPRSAFNAAEKATAITFMLAQLFFIEIILNLVTAAYHPFHSVFKVLVFITEITMIFWLNYKFFNETIVNSIWKTIVIILSIFASIYVVLFALMQILTLVYHE